MSEIIKTMIVDDHEMVRMGLRAYLSACEDILIVAEACQGNQAIELAKKHLPDVILMDLVMDGMNGIDATRQITQWAEQEGIAIKVIILTSFLEEDKVLPALEAGAISYLLKTSHAEDILRAIRKAKEGESVLEGKVSRVMLDSTRRVSQKHDALTERELEVLKQIGLGKTNKEISQDLFIGVKTVKTHVSNILSKLDIEDRTKAAIYAHRNGLCDS